jgi:hypothetical protein
MCRIAAIIFVLSMPVAGEAVFEFRRDIACALFTAIGAITLLEGRLIAGGWKRPVVAGTFLGSHCFPR